MRTLLVGLGGLCLGIIAALGPAFADDSVPLRVGRVSLVQGSAGYRPAGSDWSDAAVNLPVATGTELRTGDNGVAEFRIGDAVIALAGGSQIDVTHLAPHLVRLTLQHGRLGIVVRTLGDGDNIAIDLPRGAVQLLEPGRYDVATGPEAAPARVAVFDGRARFSGGGSDGTIASGSTARLEGASEITTKFEPARPDRFDSALQMRVTDDDPVAAGLPFSPDLAGLADLDRAGKWLADKNYGAVWFPENQADNWAPYRNGTWRWIPPWGWTWVDNAPWGFAPSHYGRWARIDDRWGWVPGKLTAEPAYVPAVVAFIGTPGVGLSYADAFGPAIAWFPLAPGEVYWPGFTQDPDLIRDLNAADVVDPSAIRLADNGQVPAAIMTAEYRNRAFASAVPRAIFMAGQPVAPALLSIPKARLETAPLIAETTQFPAAPSPRPAAVASVKVPAPVAAASAATKTPGLVAAARPAVPVLAAAAHSRPHELARFAHLAHAAPLHPGVAHVAVVQRGAHALGRLRVMASLSSGHGETHRHLAALHGRAR